MGSVHTLHPDVDWEKLLKGIAPLYEYTEKEVALVKAGILPKTQTFEICIGLHSRSFTVLAKYPN